MRIQHKTLSRGKLIFFWLITAILSLSIAFIVGEIYLRIVHPQRSMYPRWQFSSQYGYLPYSNVNIIEELPGRWRFTYTTNEYQYRGPKIPLSNSYDKKNIVIVGDSYSFGAGVDDGDEYPAILGQKLKGEFNVINFGVGGWGLTQGIRRYYEFGQLYSPQLVILQFSGNDPEDNFNNLVTVLENGRFTFQESNNGINWVKRYLSGSIIQKSQIYNLFRHSVYLYYEKNIIRKSMMDYEKQESKVPVVEEFYNELLEVFAKDLKDKGVKLAMIAVNSDLDRFRHIKEKVNGLDSSGLLDYYEVRMWFENGKKYGSPEGHRWGKKAHYIIGTKLSEIIRRRYSDVSKEKSKKYVHGMEREN